mgnify:CR=1 FL=1
MVELSKRISRGKAGGRRRGEYPGGSVPYGLLAKRSVDAPTVLVLDHAAKPVITVVLNSSLLLKSTSLIICCFIVSPRFITISVNIDYFLKKCEIL